MGLEPGLCIFRKQCGRALVLEHNGDLFSCDHFVEPACRLGNIHEAPIAELVNCEQQREFGRQKETLLTQYCRQCEVRFACNGECPKNRFVKAPDGEAGLSYLCAGYREFFRCAAPAMRMMAEELKEGRAAANVMSKWKEARRSRQGAPAAQPARAAPGRNELCPCGSGKKFKRCCMRRA